MPDNKFKNSSGQWITKSLFYEHTYAKGRELALFTLKDEDIVETDKHGNEVVYASLKKLFLSCDDPKEYEFANKHLGGWQHWQRIQDTDCLAEHIEDWREERDAKLVSECIQNIRKMAPDNFSAAKWIVEKGWEKRTERGKPSKEEKRKYLQGVDSRTKTITTDKERILAKR
jgi:hypothetical protein